MKQKNNNLIEREIVETLKQGPNFGIHGALFDNLENILQEGKERKFILGHYFGIDEKAKQLPDKEFYKKLEKSVGVTLDYSTSLIDENNKISPTPCLILGVDNKKAGNPINPDSGFGFRDTFDIGHDFYIFLGLDIHPLITPENELKEIEDQLFRFPKYDKLGQAVFIRNNLIKGMINQICDKIKSYK